MLGWLGRHRWQLAMLFAAILLPLWLFGTLARDVWEGGVFGFDEPTLLYFHSLQTPLLDRVMVFISWLGFSVVVVFDIAITLMLSLYRRWRNAIFFGLAVGGAGLLNFFAKQTFGRVRPALWAPIAPETTFSFPSGHAMASTAFVVAICVLLWATRGRWAGVVLGAVFVVLVCVSRVYLGVHYPSDVLAGCSASLAWVAGLAMLFFGRSTRAPADVEEKSHRSQGFPFVKP
jgi:membrane-associated phospholipid phosphatase